MDVKQKKSALSVLAKLLLTDKADYNFVRYYEKRISV